MEVVVQPTGWQLLDGHTIEPLVSVPMATTHKLAETATPEPELDPQGLRVVS